MCRRDTINFDERIPFGGNDHAKLVMQPLIRDLLRFATLKTDIQRLKKILLTRYPRKFNLVADNASV